MTNHSPEAPATQAGRRILLAVTGLSPQVVTETVYALAMRQPAWIPDEVHVVTTAEGARRARLALLSETRGWFRRLLQDYRLPPVAFDEGSIHVLNGRDGLPMEDIRTAQDNECAADGIAELVRRLSLDPRAELHVSLAGGRKTLGFFTGYALSLYGRPQDRLSHVLVSEPFESSWDFFYPTLDEALIQVRDGRLVDCRTATVTLADIPFVRLRDGLPETLLSGRGSFSAAVAQAQRAVRPLALGFDAPACTIVAGGERIALKPFEFALYSWLAERALAGLPGVHWSDDGFEREFLARYARIVPRASGDYERVEQALARGITKESIDPHKSRINARLDAALGRRFAAPYRIATVEPIAGTRYRRFGLQVPPSAIDAASLQPERAARSRTSIRS